MLSFQLSIFHVPGNISLLGKPYRKCGYTIRSAKMKSSNLISVQDFIDSFAEKLHRTYGKSTKREEVVEKAVGNDE